MKPKAKWKILHVRNRLGDLLSADGGVTRDEAVTEAVRLVEVERDTADGDICGEIAAIEALVSKIMLASHPVSDADMQMMLHHAACLLTLTGTFGFYALDGVVKNFCDLLKGMTRQNLRSLDPISVHVQAMRLFAPGAPALGRQEAERILGELARIVVHLGCERPRKEDFAIEADVGPYKLN